MIQHPHVDLLVTGAPMVSGSRVQVATLWQWHRKGITVETLCKRYPTLGIAKILSALAWCYDNIDEADKAVLALPDAIAAVNKLDQSMGQAKWQAEQKFREVVENYLAHDRHDPRVLADKFETSTATVQRWADGSTIPRVSTQQEVIAWIESQGQDSKK